MPQNLLQVSSKSFEGRKWQGKHPFYWLWECEYICFKFYSWNNNVADLFGNANIRVLWGFFFYLHVHVFPFCLLKKAEECSVGMVTCVHMLPASNRLSTPHQYLTTVMCLSQNLERILLMHIPITLTSLMCSTLKCMSNAHLTWNLVSWSPGSPCAFWRDAFVRACSMGVFLI